MTPRILVLAGSARRDSFNKQLARLCHRALAALPVESTYIDLQDFPMPLYHGDEEAAHGIPLHAQRLKDLFIWHQGIVFVSPEYNSSVTPLLKNAIDWISRQSTGDEPALIAFKGKLATLAAASPGQWGGMRGLVHLRSILSSIQMVVTPAQLVIPECHMVLADNECSNPATLSRIQELMQECTTLTTRLAA